MITSSANRQVKWVRTLQAKRRARQSQKKFVVEGTRLLEEVLRAARTPDLILHTAQWAERNPQLLDSAQQSGAQVEAVSDPVLASCSAVEAPQGVLAVLPMKHPPAGPSSDLILILDRLADPGNLGTLLRTALAADVRQVYLTEGSVDAYNPKVVRAAMGAHFYLRIEEAAIVRILADLAGSALWTAEARAGMAYHQVDWREPVALAIGSEAHGLHPDLRVKAAGQVHVPISAGAESLNAATAAAVILFEIKRQRGQ